MQADDEKPAVSRPGTPPLPGDVKPSLDTLFSPGSPGVRTPPLPASGSRSPRGVHFADGSMKAEPNGDQNGDACDYKPDIKPDDIKLEHLKAEQEYGDWSPSGSGYASPSSYSGSRATSAGPSSRRKKDSSPRRGPTLVPELPLAWEDALAGFDSLERCVYERKDLGLSREQDEMMVCDCVYDPDEPSANPCGTDSDCINRAIFIECLKDECKAGKHCQNQRFARKRYAPVDIVQTEKKGFGLRARENIPAGALVYEYIGEVVVEKTFRQRMTDYADEGIRHFYFMMLQKEEYIDATKKGGIGRFANHSCNPNCEVQKWVVGRRMRMGIFTKRDVLKDEEITFNYNVDRYGHEAQVCYCGEPNCVGFIGGKTQTDVGGIDDLFLDALGIFDEVMAKGMKGSRKRKARQLGEDYVPVLHPIKEHEVTKVAAAIRQSMENPLMMSRLLERVKMTEDPVIQRQLMRMHGFSLMTIILTDMAEEREVVLLALESMDQWKLTIRNKIEDSNIEEPVQALADGDDVQLASIAKQLLEYWSTLELSYKIPRVSKIASLDTEDAQNTTTIAEAEAMPRRVQYDELANNTSIKFELAPIKAVLPPPLRHRPLPPPMPQRQPSHSTVADRSKLDAIIALAQQTQVVAPTPPEPPTPEVKPVEVKERSKRRKTSHKPESEESRRRKLQKMIGAVVVKNMSMYRDRLEHETFKRYARECTHVLADKEMRAHSSSHKLKELTDEKRKKIKNFTLDYAEKVVRKLEAKGKLKKPSSTSNTSPMTPGTGTQMITPAMTPGMGNTPSGSHGTPSGSNRGLLDDIFGADEEMDIDGEDDEEPSLTADGSTSHTDMATPGPCTPPLAPSPVTTKAVVVEHASGPFVNPSKSHRPILVDRFQGKER